MPMFVTTKGYVEKVGVFPLYVHAIVTWEQVVRLETVEKVISPVGMVVVIWAKVRQEGNKEKPKKYLCGPSASLVDRRLMCRLRWNDEGPTWWT